MGWQICQIPGCNSTTDGSKMCSMHSELMGKSINKAFSLLKAQMSDIHIGFQEDPEREIERLRHMGISREEAMHMYQQYIDSLEHGA